MAMRLNFSSKQCFSFLSRTILRDACLRNSNLSGANLQDADLLEADLEGVIANNVRRDL